MRRAPMTECLFCQIVQAKIPGQIVLKDEWLTAFRDIKPQAPIHILIVTNKHISGLSDLRESDAELIGRIVLAANALALRQGFADKGYRIVTNQGKDAGQSVAHLHFHLLAGRPLAWPPG